MQTPKNPSAISRRDALKSIGGATVCGALFGSGASSSVHAAEASTSASTATASAAGIAPASNSSLPFAGVRIIEKSQLLAGRLAGQLFADQGAEVFVDRAPGGDDLDDEYFDRNKTVLPYKAAGDTSSADVIIVDGTAEVDHRPYQIVLRIVAALPGDQVYGHLPHDCSEDLLNALVGFYTDMSITGPMLGRPVIYSPLPLCSVYAATIGSTAVAAALVDRLRTGRGREIMASRIAGGLSAIGALSLTSTGLPEHFEPIQIGGLPPGLTPERFTELVGKASTDPAWQVWLERRFAPLGAPYRAKDNRWILPMAAPNRRLTRRALELLGVYDKALELGMVDKNAFDAANMEFSRNNLADSMALRFDLTSELADLLEPIFASRTAAEWETLLQANSIPAVAVNNWEEWKSNRQAHEARIMIEVPGTEGVQIGRPFWVDSARPYPAQQAARTADALPPRNTPIPEVQSEPHEKPLQGYTALDLTNVVAGPAAARMMVELGMDVTQSIPMEPQHSPSIVVTWNGESGVGKKTIIVNARSQEGAEIIHKLAAKSDMVIMNATLPQMARLGIDPVTLRIRNPKAVGLQVGAFQGDTRSSAEEWLGYDPALQGTIGVMDRFGGADSPTYHGIASCVDYLCGYFGALAGVTALYVREANGGETGDWGTTSLSAAGTITQLLLLKEEAPESARGLNATGRTAGERTYQLSDGWIFAQAPEDISEKLKGKSVADALSMLKDENILAVPVQTCREVADRHRDQLSSTIHFEKRECEGWVTECFAPTWFVFDGKPYPRPPAATRIGSDAPEVLKDLGYSSDDVAKLVENGVVGRTEWASQ